jgi:hypothetical protein
VTSITASVHPHGAAVLVIDPNDGVGVGIFRRADEFAQNRIDATRRKTPYTPLFATPPKRYGGLALPPWMKSSIAVFIEGQRLCGRDVSQ